MSIVFQDEEFAQMCMKQNVHDPITQPWIQKEKLYINHIDESDKYNSILQYICM